MGKDPALDIQNLSKQYRRNSIVLRGLNLKIEASEIVALIGPSGSGKTTLLRTIAGFEQSQSGQIWIDGNPVVGKGLSVAPPHRSVGVVFQEHALFPHLTVRNNIGFGVSHERHKKRERVDQLMELFGITHLAERFPHQISGGQIQRVGIARALAPRPTLLLLDEPFNNLDASLRETILSEVRAVLKASATAALCITHIPHEAFAIADRIAVLDGGAIIQYCDARQLYRNPVDKYVARFFGPINVLPGRYHNAQIILEDKQSFMAPLEQKQFHARQEIEILIRPGDIEFFPTESEVYCSRQDMLLLHGRVAATRYYGHYQMVAIEVPDTFPDQQITVHTDPHLSLRAQQPVQIGLPLHKMKIAAAEQRNQAAGPT